MLLVREMGVCCGNLRELLIPDVLKLLDQLETTFTLGDPQLSLRIAMRLEDALIRSQADPQFTTASTSSLTKTVQFDFLKALDILEGLAQGSVSLHACHI